MEDDILTIEEVAKYLRVSERTVYDWAQKGEVPSGKIGTVWRFKKSEIEKWVNERLSSGQKAAAPGNQIQVKNILSPDRIIFLNHSTKHDALVELASNLSTAPQVKYSDELAVEILKREELMSTAIGRGIAIPHRAEHAGPPPAHPHVLLPQQPRPHGRLWHILLRASHAGQLPGNPEHHLLPWLCPAGVSDPGAGLHRVCALGHYGL